MHGCLFLFRWKEQESYIDSLLSKLESSSASEVAKLKDSESKLQLQVQESTRRENVLNMRLATKQQEMQDLMVIFISPSVVYTEYILYFSLVNCMLFFLFFPHTHTHTHDTLTCPCISWIVGFLSLTNYPRSHRNLLKRHHRTVSTSRLKASPDIRQLSTSPDSNRPGCQLGVRTHEISTF